MNSQKKLAFLFGAGISVPYLDVTTQSITDKILSGEGIYKASNESYYLKNGANSENPVNQQWIPKICALLQLLKKESEAYYKVYYVDKNRITNYEDLYYMCEQIDTNANPILRPLLDKILPDIEPKLIFECARENRLETLAYEAMNYIHDIVWQLLLKPKKEADMVFLKEAIEDKTYSHIDIYTLNHDYLLEQYLKKNSLNYTDGFSDPQNRQIFRQKYLKNNTNRIRLLKLHGSIDWWETENGIERLKKIPYNSELRPQEHRAFRPVMLIGTLNKAAGYLKNPFSELYGDFFRTLPEKDHLVVIGYGFGDKEINRVIGRWLTKDSDLRAVFVEPDADKLENNRFIINKEYENVIEEIAQENPQIDWRDNPKSANILKINKGVENISWEEIKNELSA